MKEITLDLLMQRLMRHPLMSNVTKGTVASYTRDFLDINRISHERTTEYVAVKVVNFKAQLEEGMTRETIKAVYMCPPTGEWSHMFPDGQVGASLSPAIKRNNNIPKAQGFYFSAYEIKGNILFSDQDDIILELEYESMRTDEQGFPIMRYNGSLMMALQAWVKMSVFSDLSDAGIIAEQIVTKASRDYSWYIGQYTTNEEMLTEDEGDSFANDRENLADTRNKNRDHRHMKQHNTL